MHNLNFKHLNLWNFEKFSFAFQLYRTRHFNGTQRFQFPQRMFTVSKMSLPDFRAQNLWNKIVRWKPMGFYTTYKVWKGARIAWLNTKKNISIDRIKKWAKLSIFNQSRHYSDIKNPLALRNSDIFYTLEMFYFEKKHETRKVFLICSQPDVFSLAKKTLSNEWFHYSFDKIV